MRTGGSHKCVARIYYREFLMTVENFHCVKFLTEMTHIVYEYD